MYINKKNKKRKEKKRKEKKRKEIKDKSREKQIHERKIQKTSRIAVNAPTPSAAQLSLPDQQTD